MEGKLVAFRVFKHTDQKTIMKLCRKLYGYTDYSNRGKYTYERLGLLSRIPYVKLIRGVIIVKEKDTDKITELLKEYNAEYHTRTVKLTEKDKKILGYDHKKVGQK